MRPEDEQLLLELLSRDDFIGELITQDSPEEVIDLFDENGIKLTKEEVVLICTIVERKLNNGELEEAELEQVLGGQGIYIGKQENSPWPKLAALVGGAVVGAIGGGVAGNAIGANDYTKGLGTGIGATTGMTIGATVAVTALNETRRFIKWLKK